VSYERERLVRPPPGVGTVQKTLSPPACRGTPTRLRFSGSGPGVTELHRDSWPRTDEAIESYQAFRALNGFKADFAANYPVAERVFEDLVARELQRLTAAIPAGDLALQWDVCTSCSTSRGSWPEPRRVRGSGSPAGWNG